MTGRAWSIPQDRRLSPILDATGQELRHSWARVENVRVGYEVLHCSYDALLNGELRFPSQCADLRRIQEDEWVVADPSTLAAAVLYLWLHPKRLANPFDGVIYSAIVVG